jgi:hypothetical protein
MCRILQSIFACPVSLPALPHPKFNLFPNIPSDRFYTHIKLNLSESQLCLFLLLDSLYQSMKITPIVTNLQST